MILLKNVLTFRLKLYIIFVVGTLLIFGGAYVMKKNSYGWVFAVVGFVAALTAAITAFLLYRDKLKKEEQELEDYLDCSIL